MKSRKTQGQRLIFIPSYGFSKQTMSHRKELLLPLHINTSEVLPDWSHAIKLEVNGIAFIHTTFDVLEYSKLQVALEGHFRDALQQVHNRTLCTTQVYCSTISNDDKAGCGNCTIALRPPCCEATLLKPNGAASSFIPCIA
jgi:hypothetical protein